MAHAKRGSCRACGGAALRPFLSLGPQPLANAFLRSPDDFASEPSYPLGVYFCETCGLVQLTDVIDPETLFRDYIYVTGTSQTIAEHNERYASTVAERLGLNSTDLVVEIASNDGSLLKCFRPYGVRTLGVEPARNIAKLARDQGIETIDRFFNQQTARDLLRSHGPARAVVGNNVLAHVDEPQDLLRGAKELLTDDGLVITEVPYIAEFLDRLEYDTVYHEHLCYFSVSALLRLCDAVGLSLIAIEPYPIHGGSIRMYAGQVRHYGGHGTEVLALAAAEDAAGLLSMTRYERFAKDVEAHRRQLLRLLRERCAEGRTLAGYGAPAKGNTLLNYCGIGPDLLPFTVDRNPLKVGLYTPGMHIPVLPVTAIEERRPDDVLILAWNFAEEIMSQQHAHRARGGRFIIPFPEPHVM